MTREEIEQLYVEEPNCFETDREEQWYKVGLKEGLAAADSNPNWIPVERELPEENTAPLVRMDLTDKFGEETILYDVVVFDRNGFHTPYKVTHWQEIQPPRKEE